MLPSIKKIIQLFKWNPEKELLITYREAERIAINNDAERFTSRVPADTRLR
jgi:hypothetical protein